MFILKTEMGNSIYNYIDTLSLVIRYKEENVKTKYLHFYVYLTIYKLTLYRLNFFPQFFGTQPEIGSSHLLTHSRIARRKFF